MKKFLHAFLREKPLFFSVLRPKEASLYQPYKPFKKPVLDVGCGDGFFAKLAFGKVDVGLDVGSSEMDEAKRWKVYGVITEYDGRKIPYKDGYFSTVVCNSTFEHIPNIQEVLPEVSRVTKKGGMLYFTVPTNIWPRYLLGNKILGKPYENYFIAKSKHYNLWSLDQWKKKLAKLDFEVTEHVYYLDNPKIMWFFDTAHYMSISSLITKKLFDKWVMFPKKFDYLSGFESALLHETKQEMEKGPYMFIAAKKTS